jgi:hypothetical protein
MRVVGISISFTEEEHAQHFGGVPGVGGAGLGYDVVKLFGNASVELTHGPAPEPAPRTDGFRVVRKFWFKQDFFTVALLTLVPDLGDGHANS